MGTRTRGADDRPATPPAVLSRDFATLRDRHALFIALSSDGSGLSRTVRLKRVKEVKRPFFRGRGGSSIVNASRA